MITIYMFCLHLATIISGHGKLSEFKLKLLSSCFLNETHSVMSYTELEHGYQVNRDILYFCETPNVTLNNFVAILC